MNLYLNNTKLFTGIMLGVLIHSIGRSLFNVSKILCYMFCGLGIIIIIYNILFKTKFYMPFKGYIKFCFILYSFWSIFILIRPLLDGDINRNGYSLINQFTILAYTVPFVCYIDIRQLNLKNIFKFNNHNAVIGIIFFGIFFTEIFSGKNLEDDKYQDYIGIVGIPMTFFFIASCSILWDDFIPKSHKYFAHISWFLGIIITAYAARRGGLFLYIAIFTFYLIVIQYKSKYKIITILLTLALTGFFIFIIVNNVNSLFSHLSSRLDEDTRTGVEVYFYNSFNNKTIDWITGRGLNGTYYCPIFENPERDIIETGYLFMILKGGIIYLMLYIIILINSSYKAFFKSKNILAKVMAMFLVLHIIALIPFGLPAFNLEYIIVWVFVVYCQNNEFRALSNYSLKLLLSTNSYKRSIKHESSLVH